MIEHSHAILEQASREVAANGGVRDKASDSKLQHEVIDRLKSFVPDACKSICATVKDAIVVLAGTVASGAEKTAVEQAAKQVAAVRVIIDRIEVESAVDHRKQDKCIAEAVQGVFQNHPDIPETVKAIVENGRVTLTGRACWEYQRDAAAHAIARLPDVVTVDNKVDVL